MPLAPVDSSGTQLFYQDTGVPLGCDEYKTLVLIHGAIFNGGECSFSRVQALTYQKVAANVFIATFKPLFDYNARHRIRLVSVNMRDYRGSTPYTDFDLAELRSGEKERQRSVIRGHGLEIAAFLVWFIQKENTPPLSRDGRAGGLTLLGWSWGNAMTMAFLSQASELPADDRDLLTTHLRSLIIFGAQRLLAVEKPS